MSSNEKKAALKQLNYMEENAHLALDFTTMGTAYNVHHKDKYDNNAKVIDEVMGRIEYAMKEFNKMAPHIGGTQVPPPERHVMMEANVMYDGVYAGPTDQSSSANKASTEVDKLIKMSHQDSDKFLKTMMDMDPERRLQVTNLMNQKLQDTNQMFSMMSNLSKSQHDTVKAMINNMRV